MSHFTCYFNFCLVEIVNLLMDVKEYVFVELHFVCFCMVCAGVLENI